MDKNFEKKPGLLEHIRTYWPMFTLVLGFVVWSVSSQAVSTTSFNDLSVRVKVVEEKMPSSESMIIIYNNQAVMRAQLTTLAKNVDRLLNRE